jgi:hypothetical protein
MLFESWGTCPLVTIHNFDGKERKGKERKGKERKGKKQLSWHEEGSD